MNRDKTLPSTATSERDAGELRRVLASDVAFESWYRQTVPKVLSYLLARSGDVDLAEELCQETYLAAIAERARYDGRSDMIVWLCGIARHKLADHFRRLARVDRRRFHLEVREITLGSSPSPDRMTDHLAIADALRSLPPLQRAMLTLVALDGLSVAEAGRLIGKSRPAAQSILYRAREAFRIAYGEDGAS